MTAPSRDPRHLRARFGSIRAKSPGRAGKSAAQIALNWLLRRPGVTAPIVGARNLEQLDDNLGATGWTLGADQMARLDRQASPGFLIHTRRIPG